MTTRPRRIVKRVSNATVHSAGKRRPVVVSLYPDGTLGLRLYRARRTVYVDPATVYREAVAYEAAVARAKKRAARKGAR